MIPGMGRIRAIRVGAVVLLAVSAVAGVAGCSSGGTVRPITLPSMPVDASASAAVTRALAQANGPLSARLRDADKGASGRPAIEVYQTVVMQLGMYCSTSDDVMVMLAQKAKSTASLPSLYAGLQAIESGMTTGAKSCTAAAESATG